MVVVVVAVVKIVGHYPKLGNPLTTPRNAHWISLTALLSLLDEYNL